MFLKKKEFTYSDNTIELFELSALQRIEYFDFLVEQSQKTKMLKRLKA